MNFPEVIFFFVCLALQLSLVSFLAYSLYRSIMRRLRQHADDQQRILAHTAHSLYRNLECRYLLERRLPASAPLPCMGGGALDADAALLLLDELGRIAASRDSVRVLELGSGVSTVILARHFQRFPGQVVSCDHDARFLDNTSRMLTEDGHADKVRLLLAPLKDYSTWQFCPTFYDLTAALPMGPFDLVLVDGPPRHVHPYVRELALPLLVDYIRPGGVLVLDDAARPAEARIICKWRERFPEIDYHYHDTGKGVAFLRVQ